ncbi:TKL protein kinase [Phytophthora nicotianae INRA-310]|uniref:TKL protein kinase n=2 Tax=Phytophthora nicotianae TaxID=4792 RepID=W2PHY2_PHYN3|nr:TKL protein kinase [Phytophthora nicotianae INRA-310]ETM99803.1 TKL protein kinase [Phytophthora nicotianae INRA-310]KUF78620.1 serine/threonine-protein kinase drkA [Phytophthora nicotianae]
MPPATAFLAVLALLQASEAAVPTYLQTAYWENSDCSGTPFYINIIPEANCEQTSVMYTCLPYIFDGSQYYRATTCVADTHKWIKSYNMSRFLAMEQFSAGCDEYLEGNVLLANDSCVKIMNSTSYRSGIANVGNDASMSLKIFADNACTTAEAMEFLIEGAAVNNNLCFDGQYKFYSQSASNVNGTTNARGVETRILYSSSGSIEDSNNLTSATTISTGSSYTSTKSGVGKSTSIVIVVVALVVTVAACCLFFWCRRRSTRKRQEVNSSTAPSDVGGFVNAVLAMEIPMETRPTNVSSVESNRDGGEGEEESALWRNEVILGARVPREKVVAKRLISRGGYGEVYVGAYNRRRVALKMLLPETRKSKAHRISFLAEMKLMATLEHPRIVRLIGIAWDSPNDLCGLIEFIPGGDLRALLNKYAEAHRPIGFTYEKAKIASHVAHALTYLHSLIPAVIHRDLKSKNILLTRELDAKLTDFGVSREHVDRTMTAGVGTSLWISPEVMMGERYDDKADIFSLGVVLSELNTHAMPYAHAKPRDGSGDRLPDTAILQLVAGGKLRADFSQGGPEALMQLGLACVALDPKDRPTAPEVLYRLQKAMREMTT